MIQDQLLGMRILIVDDEPVNIALLEDLLQFSGYSQVISTSDPRRVLALCQERRPDLILLDLNMPGLDGFGVMKQLSAEICVEECVPILVLTADIGLETKRRALSAGATDFLTKPFDPVEVLLRIKNLLKTRHQHLQLSDQKTLLEDSVRERTAELRETLAQLRDAQNHLVQQERLSALGSMTAGIAHDFNNVLSLILGYSEMLMRSLQRPDGARMASPLLGTIITAAQDAAKMFNRLREFYRPADGGQPRQLIDLNELVERAVALTRPRWHGQALAQGATIDVRCELGPNLPELLADGAELRELLTNLIFNAVDAPARGRHHHRADLLRGRGDRRQGRRGDRPDRARPAAGGGGHGRGHERGNPPPLPGAVLYHQGHARHGPGAGDGLRHGAAPRGQHRPAQRPGRGHPLRAAPAVARAGPGGGKRPARRQRTFAPAHPRGR